MAQHGAIAGSSKVHQGEKGSRDGPGKTALLKHPTTICLDPSGRVFIGDGQQGVLRIVDASLPWAIARLLYIAVLKSKGSQGGDRAKRDGVDEDAAAQEGCEWAAWAGLKTHIANRSRLRMIRAALLRTQLLLVAMWETAAKARFLPSCRWREIRV